MPWEAMGSLNQKLLSHGHRVSKRHGWDSPDHPEKTHDGSFFQWKMNENHENEK